MSTLEIASILPSHEDFSYELHEVLDFVLMIVHEEVVDLVKSFVSLMSTINFSSLRLGDSSQFLNTCPIRIGLKLVFLNLGSKISENLLFCLSMRILMVSFSISRLGFSLLHELSELSSCTGLPVLE